MKRVVGAERPEHWLRFGGLDTKTRVRARAG
jgi:hypothetical protein